jgi:hypothetical protein
MKKILSFSVAFCFVLLLGVTSKVQAQGSETYGKGIRINLDTTGKRYIRFITWHQFWSRYTDNNPGTIVNGTSEAGTMDIGLRRSRFLWYTQISPKFLILMHIGINNQTFVNGGGSGTPGVAPNGTAGAAGTGGYGIGKKPQLFIHDMWTEYQVAKDKLYIGTGLHYWNGISRLASASTLNFLALDAPIFNWPLIEETDQFARQFGIYAKGKLPIGKKKLDYRIYVNKPFATPINIPAGSPANFTGDSVLVRNPNRAISSNNNNASVGGYFSFEIFESESNVLPFFVGSYLGTKKVFNIGAGFHYHANATRSFTAGAGGGYKNHNMTIFGIDAFLDLPLNKEKGTAFTGYALYQNMNFGQNYIRAIGIMNEGQAPGVGTLAQGGGNTDWRMGTGGIFYAEAGYLLPKRIGGKIGRFQPFGTLTYRNFEFLKDASINYALGFNWLIDGHHAKISFKYQNRALYSSSNVATPSSFNLVTGDKLQLNANPNIAGGAKNASEFIIQTQIYL